MRTSANDLSVFDFKTDEKLTSLQFLKIFTSNSHHLKQSESSAPPPMNLHEVDSPESSPPSSDSHEVESPESFTPVRNAVSNEEKFKFDDPKACSASNYKHTIVYASHSHKGQAIHDSRNVVALACNDEDSEPQSSEVPENLWLDEEEHSTSVSGASSTSGDFFDCKGPSGDPALELCYSSCGKMEENQNAVIVCPDYVNYRDSLFLESQLTFYSTGIKVECSDTNGSNEKLSLVCDIADIIQIRCQWSTTVEAVLFKFWIRTKTNEEHGVEKFMASIADVLWLEKEQKIKVLAEKYNVIWDTLFDNTYGSEDDICMTHVPFSKRYFSEIMEPPKDVIYPKGDPDAVSISKRDIELLEPDTFINDTIIDFYIKYLQNKVEINQKNRFYFFNSFFFRKLADLDKDPQSISEGRAAFQRVRKWTRKLNIFEKDYIFIPVNFNLHWSLLVICHPGEINSFSDNDLKNSSKVPCILHMDSIKGSHNGLKDLIQSYLLEEWKGRHPDFSADYTSRFSNLRFVSLELPQQGNTSDCGLFLLHYVELFLKEAPISFNPIKISRLSSFLNADWFPPAEASFKRFNIRRLLYDLFRDSSEKATPTCSNGDLPGSGNDADQAVDFVFAESSQSMIINGKIASRHCTTLDDDGLKKGGAFECVLAPCIMEERGDANTDANENEDSSEQRGVTINGHNGCQPLFVSTVSQTCVIDGGSCEPSSAFEEKQVAVAIALLSTRSNDQLAESESQKLASAAVDRDFIPNSHNNLDERHYKPQRGCLATDDHNINDKKHLDTFTEGAEKMHEVRCDNFEALETENWKSRHCSESDLAIDEVCIPEDGNLAEDFNEGDVKISAIENTEEVADSQGINTKGSFKEINDVCKENMLSNDDPTMIEIISLDNDVVVQPMKCRPSESILPNSKRRRIAPQELRRRVTRSFSKECSS